jgi:hypothetical protein
MKPATVALAFWMVAAGCTSSHTSPAPPRPQRPPALLAPSVTPDASAPTLAPHAPVEPPTQGISTTAVEVFEATQAALGAWTGERQVLENPAWPHYVEQIATDPPPRDRAFVVLQMSGTIDSTAAPDTLRVRFTEGVHLLADNSTLVLGAHHIANPLLHEVVFGVSARAIFEPAQRAPVGADRQCVTQATAGACTSACEAVLDRVRAVTWTLRLPPARVEAFRAGGPSIVLNLAGFVRPRRASVRAWCGREVTAPVIDLTAFRVSVGSIGTSWDTLRPSNL